MKQIRAAETRQAVGRKAWVPYAFLVPYCTLAAIFFLYPLVNAVGLAFYETNGPRSRIFVGLENFRYLANDDLFYSALINTTVFACVSVLVQLPLSMGLALLLNSGLSKSKGFFRLILFSPNLVGQIFVGILFSVLFTARYGLVNRGFQAVLGWGLKQQWLDDPSMAMPGLILTSLWLWVGFNMIYFLAALQSVDKTLEEAARIDGANAWQVFFHVTLPSMRHVVVFVLIMSIIGSFQLFELPLAMFHETHGLGPENAGITLITYLNRMAFELGDLGLGSAVGWIVTLVIMGVSLIQLSVTGAAKD